MPGYSAAWESHVLATWPICHQLMPLYLAVLGVSKMPSDCRPEDQASMPGYSAAWESHVLATWPMWSQLMPLFLRQTAGRASAHGHPALADLLNVSSSCQCPALG